jgi:hypothetical protein
MKLSNYHRQTFVDAVMNDVPRVEYSEQARSLIHAEAAAQLPAEIKKIYDNKELRGWLQANTAVATPRNLSSVYAVAHAGYKPSPELQTILNELSELAGIQHEARAELRARVKATIAACSTRARAMKMLPEFEKYLPSDDNTTSNLPAVANLAAELVKAGWPKGKAAA